MAAHAHTPDIATERIRLDPRASKIVAIAAAVGGAGLVLSLVLGIFSSEGFRRFLFSYLVAFAFCLTIAFGAMAFVLLQHVTRAGWSVSVRRIAENIIATFPVLGVLSLPIVFSVVLQNGQLYPWALPLSSAHRVEKSSPEPHNAPPAEASSSAPEGQVKQAAAPAVAKEPVLDELMLKKRGYLDPWFFVLRMILYFGVWTFLGRHFHHQSVLQDQTGDVAITAHLAALGAPMLVVAALTLTFASFDLLMSLDPHWFSTMFGVYIFAGSAVASYATLIITLNLLQRAGYLRESISTEHFHDLGKYLFGFVFFFGYIAFSQYMLLWYASIPEEIAYLERHGMTTAHATPEVRWWSYVAIAVLFGHVLIPFGGLLSRHVKRNNAALIFWAVWLLFFHYLDLYWIVMPEMKLGFKPELIDLTCLLGVGGIFVAAFVRSLAAHSLRPTSDPRLGDALAFQNV